MLIILGFSLSIFSGCLSEVPGGAGSEISVPERHLDPEKVIAAIRLINGVSILHKSIIGNPSTLFTITFLRSDGARGAVVFYRLAGTPVMQLHTLALAGNHAHLPEVEFSLIHELYLRLRSAQPDLPDPRTVTVVRDYGLVRGRKLEGP